MAHCRLLFVGTVENIHQIYADCPDSSSESAEEMAFGADYICEYREGYERQYSWNTPEFTKAEKEYYQQILDGLFVYCFDIRDTKKYGDYGWINIPSEMEEVNPNCHEKEERNKERIINHIKGLPDDTVFWFANSHW